jgi:hypothetical protein
MMPRDNEWEFTDGTIVTFDTHMGDSMLNHRTGEQARVIRTIRGEEYDFDEVGPMYEIEFADGTRVQAFADEISNNLTARKRQGGI